MLKINNTFTDLLTSRSGDYTHSAYCQSDIMRYHEPESSVVEKGKLSVFVLSFIPISSEIVRKTDKDKESTRTTVNNLSVTVPHLYESPPLKQRAGDFSSLMSVPSLFWVASD